MAGANGRSLNPSCWKRYSLAAKRDNPAGAAHPQRQRPSTRLSAPTATSSAIAARPAAANAVIRHRSSAAWIACTIGSLRQIDFVNLIVNHLTEHGTMDAAQLYASPHTDLTPRGPEGLFSETAVQELVSLLDAVKRSAAAAAA